jgi:tripartite-type tricarboxylate transporter receptor subunit TctC
MKAKTFALGALVLGACLSSAMAAGKKDGAAYPTQAITMIVPYSAGGTADLTGRQFALQLRKYLGQTITVVNQAGASGAVGAKTVFDAPPDGYTVLYTAESLGTQRVMGLSEMKYDDFTPIRAVVNDPKVIVVKKGSKYKTLQDLVNDMRANPKKVKMSYTGPGGSGHVQSLVYNKFGLDPALTAYPGGAECLLAVLSDQVDFTNSNYSTVPTYLESGDLVLLGISATERLPGYPDVPTLADVIPEAKAYLGTPFSPLSFMVNNKVPAEVVATLKAAATKAVNDPEWKKFVRDNNLEELYVKYPNDDAVKKFYADWESTVSWMLFDAGVAKFSPEKFGIPRAK